MQQKLKESSTELISDEEECILVEEDDDSDTENFYDKLNDDIESTESESSESESSKFESNDDDDSVQIMNIVNVEGNSFDNCI